MTVSALPAARIGAARSAGLEAVAAANSIACSGSRSGFPVRHAPLAVKATLAVPPVSGSGRSFACSQHSRAAGIPYMPADC